MCICVCVRAHWQTTGWDSDEPGGAIGSLAIRLAHIDAAGDTAE